MNKCSTARMAYAEVAVDAQLADRRATLTYAVPPSLVGELEAGQLIWVPLKRDLVLGVVVELTDRRPRGDYRLREIHAPVEPAFRLTPLQWQLAVWTAEETICSLFEAASAMLPPGVGARTVEYLELVREPDESEHSGLTRLQRRLLDRLVSNQGMTLDAARSALDSKLTTVVPALEERGLIRRVARVRHRPASEPEVSYRVRLLEGGEPPPERAYRQREVYEWLAMRLRARPDMALPLESVLRTEIASKQVLEALERRGLIAVEPVPTTETAVTGRAPGPVRLTREQEAAWQEIDRVRRNDPAPRFLLHGVTGSGKTEVYFRVISDVLAEGRSAILLVPEISLAGQVIERARARFGNQALVLHSSLDDRQRYDNWIRAGAGEPLVVVGPRSALFAPLPDIGLIIVDEEHEGAYKQEQPPRYHVRTVAEKLAALHGAALILGSATPDVESQYRALAGHWRLLRLTERIGQRVIDRFGDVHARPIPLPEIDIVDMRHELREDNPSLFSRRLQQLIGGRLEAGEQTILFLNRRGMSTFVQCRSCGVVRQCPLCDIPLVYHRAGERLICHRCGYRTSPPRICPECGSGSIGYYGAGTQRVEAEIGALFNQARVMRWDQDALRGGVTHEMLLGRVQRGEVDIVVGTQMISRGLDLSNVTLVGVVNADTYLYLPDFRAAERTFQMLVQVAGRAGRRAAGGEVVIQTYSPDHYAIDAAARHDYDAFYREEIAFRSQHGHPPFKRLVRLLHRSRDNERAQAYAEQFADEIERFLIEHPEYEGIDLLGPAPAFAARIRGQYGWQILLRGDQAPRALGAMMTPFGWSVDVDPVSML